MNGSPPDPGLPPSTSRSLVAAAVRGGALGMLAGVSGGAACWLTLLLWDSLEDGRLVWPAAESLWPVVAFVVLGVVLCIPLGVVLHLVRKW